MKYTKVYICFKVKDKVYTSSKAIYALMQRLKIVYVNQLHYKIILYIG